MADENEVDVIEEGGAKKGIPKLVIIIAAVVILAVGGYFGVTMFMGGEDDTGNGKDTEQTQKADEKKENAEKKKDADVKKNDEDKTEGKADGEEKEGEGTEQKKEKKGKGNLRLSEFLVNLNDPLVRRYLKCVINLRLSKASYVDEINENENIIPELRDKIFDIVSDKSYADLKSSAGKVMLKEEIMISVNEILYETFKTEPVIKVMFSKFILQ